MTNMSEEWGKDIHYILTLSQQSTDSIDARIIKLDVQNDREHEGLCEKIEDANVRQVVLITSVEAMEAQMRELLNDNNESVPEQFSPTGQLPPKQYEELAEE